MYDSGKIILGIIIFLGLFTFPTWYLFTDGETARMPELVLPEGEEQIECIDNAEFMRASHMDLLNDWRDKVVRNGERIFTSSTGKQYEMSLTKTCLGCHSRKEEFCDRCHNYMEVTPYCWDCHVESLQPESK